MSHKQQRDFVNILSETLPEFFNGGRVLEIGSLNINGTIRDFFNSNEYIGLDIGPGNGVDVVCEGQKYDAPDNSFDHVISCEAMEHNPYWVETFKNMVRLCKSGGLVTMTCATTGRREHGTSRTQSKDSPLTTDAGWNYYLNLTANDFKKKIEIDKLFSYYFFATDWRSYDLYFVGIKRPNNQEPLTESIHGHFETARTAIIDHLNEGNNLKIYKYRSFVASTLGDWWFIKMRKIAAILDYVHD